MQRLEDNLEKDRKFPMRITRRQLRKLILEESKTLLKEYKEPMAGLKYRKPAGAEKAKQGLLQAIAFFDEQEKALLASDDGEKLVDVTSVGILRALKMIVRVVDTAPSDPQMSRLRSDLANAADMITQGLKLKK